MRRTPAIGLSDTIHLSADLALVLTHSGTCKGDSKLYPVGHINTIIYPVDGGMEDWMYDTHPLIHTISHLILHPITHPITHPLMHPVVYPLTVLLS